jgi:hypothetical protein
MTAEGQRRARERNLTIRAYVCDAHTLPFADNSFDAMTLQLRRWTTLCSSPSTLAATMLG